MRAEVAVTFKKDLPTDTSAILISRFGSPADQVKCVALTSLADLTTIVSAIQFSKLSNSAVRLYFRDEIRVLKIHIESVSSQGIKAIRREIDDTISDMKRLAEAEKTSLKDFRVIISSDEGDFQEGNYSSFLDKLKKSITENIPTKIYVPIATLAVSYFMPTGDVNKPIFNAFVAIAATILWVLIDAVFFRPSLKYTEV